MIPVHPIEVLTQDALAASETGHWDRVVSLYQRRSSEFVLERLPAMVAQRLIRMDQVIQERARVVQAATQQNLLETQERRRKLRHWKHQWMGTTTPTPARLVKSV